MAETVRSPWHDGAVVAPGVNPADNGQSTRFHTAKNEELRTAGPSLAILQRLEVRLWKVGDSHYPAVELAVGERLERRGGLLGGRPG